MRTFVTGANKIKAVCPECSEPITLELIDNVLTQTGGCEHITSTAKGPNPHIQIAYTLPD